MHMRRSLQHHNLANLAMEPAVGAWPTYTRVRAAVGVILGFGIWDLGFGDSADLWIPAPPASSQLVDYLLSK